MRGFLIVYDIDNQPVNILLLRDSMSDYICDNYNVATQTAKILIWQISNNDKSVYISEENYSKVDILYEANQFDLLRELYHTLKAEESIIDRENRIMELNNKITGIDESIKE